MKHLMTCIVLVLGTILAAEAAGMPTEKEYTNSIGLKLVRIEPGTFNMGYGDGGELPQEIIEAKEHGGRSIGLSQFGKNGDFDEHPTHKVTITQPFYMGIYEVTNRQYEKFDPLHMHLRGKRGFSIDNDEAVVFVNWHQAKAFCDWLSKKEGLPYRLPTEAEWEYACRAGTKTQFYTGNTLPEQYLKNPDNSWYPCPDNSRGREEVVPLYTGRTEPNPWGLHDMHGNVEEWCYDWYGPYENRTQIDPVGPIDGDFKVTRGGSHGTVAYYLRSCNRMGTLPEDRTFMIGFRIVLGKLPDTKPMPTELKPLYQQNVKQKVPSNITKGPDPTKPFFRGPRNYVKIKEGSIGPLFSRHNHDPAIVECPNGDLISIWYTCITERGRELALAASRLRYGNEQWEPASPFWDAADRNDHAPAMWYDGNRMIYHFVGLSTAATWGPLAIVMRTSIDNGATWSRARLIMPEHQRRNQATESVFCTREGYIILACDATPRGSGGTAIHISKDNGLTWTDPGGTIAGIHAGVAQIDDGRLIALGRGDNIKIDDEQRMPMSISNDMGKTWNYRASQFPPIGGGQRLVLVKLKQGPLFLASFANGKPSVKVTDVSEKKRNVKGLFGALSYDGGQTWPHIRLITDDGADQECKTTDGRNFTMGLNSAEPSGYLSVCQSQNGVIHLISSWNHYEFNLKWLQTPPPAKPVSRTN